MAAKKTSHKIAGKGSKSENLRVGTKESNKGRSVLKKRVLTTLSGPVPEGMIAYVKGNEVIAIPRKPRGKSKRVGCNLRSKAKPNKAGGSRKMTKAQVAAEFQRSFLPYLHDDVAVRTAWNDHVDVLHKQGLVSAAVANSSVPVRFLKRKANKAGGSRKMTKAQVAAEFQRSGLPYLHDDVAVRTAWNDHVDVLHKQGLVSAAVANSSVPVRFLKRKANKAGGRRSNRTGGHRSSCGCKKH